MSAAAAQIAVLEFNQERHEYRFNGAVVPHVTSVTDSLASYAGISDNVLRKKAEIGTAVHYATELEDEGDLDDASLPAVLHGYIEGYRRFKHETGFTADVTEYRVYSNVYHFAGTLDRIGRFERLKGIRPLAAALVDYKATYTIMPSVGPQTAAYERAWNEQSDRKVLRRFALQLKPHGTYSLHECKDVSDWSVFLSALTLMNWRARHKQEISI